MANRLIGAAVAVGAAYAALNGPEQLQAQTNPECAAVYDESETGENSPSLERVINDYADNGVDVHVQILESGRNRDITQEGEAGGRQVIEWREDLTVECGWDNPNRINVTIVKDPRVFEIFKIGSVDTAEMRQAVNDIEGSFVDDLRDQDSPFQSDIARMLEAISPFRPEQSSGSASGNSGESDGLEFPSIPLKEILIGTAAAGVLGAVAARTKRAVTLKRNKDELLLEPSRVNTDIADVMWKVDQILGVLPDDDAQLLRDKNKQVGPRLIAYQDAKDALDAEYAAERFRVWPSVSDLEDIVQPLLDELDETEALLEELRAEYADVENNINTIDDKVQGFKSLVASVEASIEAMKSDGWDVGELQGQFDDFWPTLERINVLRAGHYIDRPADMIRDFSPKLGELKQAVEVLPSRREVIDGELAAQVESISDFSAQAAKATDELDTLKQNYHPECSDDLSELGEELAKLLQQLLGKADQFAGTKGVKSLEAILESERLSSEFNTIAADISQKTNTIFNRLETVQMIERDLTIDIDNHEQDLSSLRSYIQQNSADLEDDVREELTRLTEQLQEAKSGSISDKPKYLTIDKLLNEIRNDTAELDQKASAQKVQMDEYRQVIQVGSAEAESQLAGLLSYASRSRGDLSSSTRSLIQSLSVRGFSIDGDRRSLRAESEAVQDLLQQISRAENQARRDVRRAEDERAAERRRIQREEDERRRRNSLSSSSGSSISGGFGGGFGGFGGGGGGSGGGGSSNSGGW